MARSSDWGSMSGLTTPRVVRLLLRSDRSGPGCAIAAARNSDFAARNALRSESLGSFAISSDQSSSRLLVWAEARFTRTRASGPTITASLFSIRRSVSSGQFVPALRSSLDGMLAAGDDTTSGELRTMLGELIGVSLGSYFGSGAE